MSTQDSGITLRDSLYGFEMREVDNRRVDHENKKTYEAKQMWQLHHEIVNLSAEGWNNVDIARILNCHPQTVSNVLNSRLGEKKLSDLRKKRDGDTELRMEQIRVLTEKAISVYHEVFDNEGKVATLKDRRETADKVLMELSGLRVPTKISTQSVGVQLTAEEFAAFKARGVAASREAGLVVSDAEGEKDEAKD